MMNIVAFNYRKCLGGLLAIGLCLVVASAQAEVIQWNYDGSYDPDGGSPPAGQSDWLVYEGAPLAIVPNSPIAGVADFKDNLNNQRIAMYNLFTGTEFASDPGDVEWEYSFVTSFTGWGGEATRRAYFGVRDEGGSGKKAMFGHGEKDGSTLIYDDGYEIWEAEEGEDLLTGEYHTYEVRKYLDASDIMQVEFSLDGNVVDTRLYSAFPDDAGDGNGFGTYGNTLGTADYLVDDVHFGIIPEPTTAALLVGLLVVPLLWRRKNVL